MTRLSSLLPAISSLLAACLCNVGCATYRDEAAPLRRAWQSGDIQKAAAEAQKGLGAHDTAANRLVWQLEAGATARAAQDFEASEAAFSQAQESAAYWDQKPDLLAGYEINALLVNPAQLPYRGTGYDRIMLDTYRALNALQKGSLENARVELNRALESQRRALEQHGKSLAAAREAAANQKPFIDNAQNDSALSEQVGAITAPLEALPAYAPFVNPFSVWLDGIFFLHTSTGNSDTERALKSLRRVADMVDGALVAEDIALAQSGARADQPITYIVFETGIAPWRIQRRIDIPTFFISRDVPYVGMALPELVFHSGQAPSLAVIADGVRQNTRLVADMDAVVGQEFKAEFPTILTRTLLSAAAKAAAQYGAAEGARAAGNNDWATAVQIIGVIYQAATNNADLRTWSTLPKQFQILRLKTPQNRHLTLEAGAQRAQVSLLPGKVNIVYAKSIAAHLPLIVSQLVLVP